MENATDDGGLGVLVGDTEYVLGSADDVDAANVTTTVTWWIDVEATYPIKEQVVTEYDEPRQHALERERTVRTVTYEDVRFDEPIPDDRFAFDPPAGTDVVEPIDSVEVSTIDEADDAVPFSVSEPTLPDGYELVIVTASEFDGDATVQFLYRDGDSLEDDEILGRITERPPAYDPKTSTGTASATSTARSSRPRWGRHSSGTVATFGTNSRLTSTTAARNSLSRRPSRWAVRREDSRVVVKSPEPGYNSPSQNSPTASRYGIPIAKIAINAAVAPRTAGGSVPSSNWNRMSFIPGLSRAFT